MDLVVDTVVQLATRGHTIELIKAGPSLPRELAQRVTAAGARLIERSDGTLRTPTAQADIYSQATLLLFPSSHEGFGLPVAEAMAVGLPVVASDIEALREVSGGFAAHVDGDAMVLASAVDRLVRDPAMLERMSEEGRLWATRYRWAAYAFALREVYTALTRS
jgi:glycosyltransferase involved in cell wall biosynthesis